MTLLFVGEELLCAEVSVGAFVEVKAGVTGMVLVKTEYDFELLLSCRVVREVEACRFEDLDGCKVVEEGVDLRMVSLELAEASVAVEASRELVVAMDTEYIG